MSCIRTRLVHHHSWWWRHSTTWWLHHLSPASEWLVKLCCWGETLSLGWQRLIVSIRTWGPRRLHTGASPDWALSLSHFLLPHLISLIRSYWWLFTKDICLCRLHRRWFWNTIWGWALHVSLQAVLTLLVTHVNPPIALTHITYVSLWLLWWGAWVCILRAKYWIHHIHISVELCLCGRSPTHKRRSLIQKVWVE